MAEVKRKRKANFTTEELEILVDEVSKRKRILFDKFNDSLSIKTKVDTWKDIASKVNAVSSAVRTHDDIRKKWSDFASASKGKGSQRAKSMRKTGGGKDESPALTTLEEKALSVLGPTAVDGIGGAVDTAEPEGLPITNGPDANPTVMAIGNEETSDSDSDIPGPSKAVTATSKSDKQRHLPLKKRAIKGRKAVEYDDVLEIEREKLNIKRERLEVEKRKLVVQEKILSVLEKALENGNSSRVQSLFRS